MKTPRILIIDDEKEICELVKVFLSKKNYSCFSATTEREALGLIKKEHPQLVLLDLRLGDISGIDVLGKIKELDKNIKVIMVTALDDAESIRQARELGADDYICKPFTATYLNELISLKTAEFKDTE